jgi:uncharacterized protein YecT (DUF1311 family)
MACLRLLAVAVGTVFAAPLATAASPTPLEQCNESAMGMHGLGHCQQTELQRQQARLRGVYYSLPPALDSARRAQLPALQRQWATWRQANCRFHVDPGAGTLQTMQAAQCQAQMTQARADELAKLQQAL